MTSSSRSPASPFTRLLTHLVLPYSNWEWEEFRRLGGITPTLQTDSNSAATH